MSITLETTYPVSSPAGSGTPPAATTTGTTSATVSTTFSPSANAMVVVVVTVSFNGDFPSGCNISGVTDGTNAYTAGPQIFDNGTGGANDDGVYIWYHKYTTAPGSITVTATRTNTNAASYSMTAYALDGCSGSVGASATHFSTGASSNMTGSITTTQGGSWTIVGATGNNNHAVNGSTNLTAIDYTLLDGTDNTTAGVGHAVTASPGLITMGFTTSSSVNYAWAALEILATTSSLAITTSSPLPGGTQGTPYSTTISATGGTPPYSWSITSGAPGGLNNIGSSTGVVSGTPTSAGTFSSFIIQVTDAASNSVSKTFSITITSTGGMVIGNVISGNVVNDYGLDDVPYTVSQTGASTMLVAFVGWNVAQQTYQANTSATFPFGKSPAVNVTDSAGNLWRQVGISTAATAARGAIWVADNPSQVNWVSVALTGWGNSTAYMIAEIDNVPSGMQAVSLDFTKTANNTAFTTALTVPTGTATGTDTVLGLVVGGGQSGSLTVPAGFTGVGSVGGVTSTDVTTYAMWIPSQSAGSVAFVPTWAGSVPSAGVTVALKQTAPAPSQPNPNMPRVIVEAAFGAVPGDYTASVDYTFDITGLVWTDISSRCIAKENSPCVRVKRGRQYELSQEETGTVEVLLDNHDGAFTSGNTTSPFYPNVIPGVPIRVTAWYNNVQYAVAFGYAERWPQEWPDMPQWGFSSLTATDAWGALSATSLPSAVEGDIRKDNPYAYFPTDEQYSFTSQSLTPTASPLDANGMIAVNKAPGNNRYAAYRDGFIQAATTGQALNLLGDEDTTLGISTYTAQEVQDNGPGLFYFDPNIPTNNASNQSYAYEFWFLWGQTSSFSCTLFSAWGRPSSFFGATNQTAPTNGGVVTVGVNTGINDSGTVASGFYVNGLEVTNGTFNQTTFAPQHCVITCGSDGTTVYLNGAPTATSPTFASVPQVRAVCLGPARFSYDVSDLVVYNGYNYTAGHLAIYDQELTPLQIQNHFTSGINGFVGVPAPGRFAQALTWGRLGLKRGGTAWYQTYGVIEGTYLSEAYAYEGTTGADVMNQLVQTEGGRCYTQANGSLVYVYRWYLYNMSVQATFGDNGTTEFPFEQDTTYSLDNQFIYNQITGTQQRGPNQDFYVFNIDFTSNNQYFERSGLQYTSYAMLPFDVFDRVNWATTKYRQPVQRVQQITIDAAKTGAKFTNLFPTLLGLDLNDMVTVNRRPVGGAVLSVTGSIQEVSHEIGPAYWKTTYQVSPFFPESNALVADVNGQNSPGTQYLSW